MAHDDPGVCQLSSMHSQAITHGNSTESSLLRLPGELRNKIYDYVLANCRIYLDRDRFRPGVSHAIRVVEVDGSNETHLFGGHCLAKVPNVCRQLYTETRNHFATMSEFAIATDLLTSTRQLSAVLVFAEQIRVVVRFEPPAFYLGISEQIVLEVEQLLPTLTKSETLRKIVIMVKSVKLEEGRPGIIELRCRCRLKALAGFDSKFESTLEL